MKYFLGPMSKNIVESIRLMPEIGLIPSRRQVDFCGGYVEGWTQKDLREIAGPEREICRDHAGPLQGNEEDDGINSLKEDSCFFNCIHIDPWKKHFKIDEGANKTAELLSICYQLNNNLTFEISTEQAVRPFSLDEMNKIIELIKGRLSKEEYGAIKYFVIQSGVALDIVNRKNVGCFNENNLINMIKLCKDNGLLSKEHNGDYLSHDQMELRMSHGLDAINIAPEIAQWETDILLRIIDDNIPELEDNFFKVCHDSLRWKKWVSKTFVPEKEKRKLIEIAGHYVFSTKEVKQIKSDLSDKIGLDVDSVIKEEIKGLLSKYE